MRLFTAVEVPEDVSERIAGICHGLPGVRWTPPDQFHMTLRFIGEVSEAQREEISETLSGVHCDSFTLHLRGLGQFLHRRMPGVIWLDVEMQPALEHLHRKIESALRGLGFPGDKRAFQPHVTIARLKTAPSSRVQQYLDTYGDFDAGSFEVNEFLLLSSVLRPNGATHTVEDVYDLHPDYSDGGEQLAREADQGAA